MKNNIAFIDGQNLYFSGKTAGLDIDLSRFRVYLREKYKVEYAYYYLGSILDEHLDLYNEIKKSGFILVFREHGQEMTSIKKGNVDTDIVFDMMKNFIKNKDFEKILLVSGDGDYFKTVRFLIEENRFLKILFPSKKSASSLYKMIDIKFRAYLEESGIKQKITKLNEKASLGN